MAKNIYDEKIDKNTDWGGDESTGGLPVSGRRVQEFIKGELNGKYGYSRVMDEKFLQQFPDEESARLYDQNPQENEHLLLSSLQLPGTGETVAIMRVTVLETPAEYTTRGVTEKFVFRYLSYYNDETDLSPVRGEAILAVNGMERQRLELRSGSTYTMDVTAFLTGEKNTVQITVTNNEGSTRNFVYDVNIVDLAVTSSFDDTMAYKGNIPFRYTPVGNILKTVHFILDDEEIHTEETTANNRQLTYEIPARDHGAHLLQVYLTAEVAGNHIRSNTLAYDIISVEDGNMTPIIASDFSPSSVKQYETITIPFVVHDPAGTPTGIQLLVNGEKVSERNVDRTRQTWTYKANDKGTLALKIQCKGVFKEFTFDITESVVTSEAETRDLDLYLTSRGRSNQDTNREEWKYNDIVASFSGMNWITNGWVVDDDGSVCLRLGGGAKVDVPLKIFSGDTRQAGKTIELEFSVREVTDYSATILSCLAGGIGLKLTPNVISLFSEQSQVEMHYKENERVRVTFVIEKQADNRLMQILVNGIKSRSFQYPTTDSFTQANPIGISIGSNSATIDLYNIRVYSNNLNTSQLLDNYIADIDNIDKKIAVFERNQVFDSYGNLNMNALRQQIPVMVITGDLPNYKGDKKTARIEYMDVKKPDKSFVAEGCTLDVQGTSSQYYPRKNFKFTAKNGFEMTTGGHADGFTLNDEECLPATVFCLKTDFAESSGTHNTGIADLVDWLTKQAGILTGPQKSNPIIRTTIYGEPCVMFHKKDENSIPEFIGKYNFNTDKNAENTFGFASNDESWEFLNNTSDMALWKTANFENWRDTLEARYPGGNENITRVKEVFEWVVSCKDNTEKFKTELEQHFDKNQLIFYYLITLVFGMVDQRAKNMFLTVFSGGNWLFIFYDNDTCMGINNEGAISFSYNIEIHDVIGSLDVWNGADSELWKLVETSFPEEIQQLYYNLRQKGVLSYNKVFEYTNTRQSDKWCEAVYNEDGYFKYEQPLIEGYEDWSSGSPVMTKTGAYLYALQGSRDAHRRWWLYNRFKYLDSKFQAGSSLNDFATFRTYTPTDWKGVAPKADITLKSFAAMYGTVKWGSVTRSERMGEGETKTIKAPDGMVFNDTETIIYNASMISSLGDLAPLYPGTVDVSRMTNLTELIIGSNVSGYKNTNFTVLSVGSNHVLRKLDIRNCPSFTQPIEVSACESIEEIYATGTSATAVNLAEGGALRVLHLPATIANLTLRNQPNLSSGLKFEGMGNLSALVVEATPQVDGYKLAKDCLSTENSKLSRVRLIGIQGTDTNLENLNRMATMLGIDELGNQTEHAIITGSLHVESAFDEEVEELGVIFPDLVITYDTLSRVPTRVITVIGRDTQGAVSGATVTINGTEYTTGENGQVSITSRQALEVMVNAEGYIPVSASYRSSSINTQNTIYLDRTVTLEVKAVSQYGGGVANVKVVFNGETKVTSANGIVSFETRRGTYSCTATYKGNTLEETVTIEQVNKMVTFKFTVEVEDFRPVPNGNIQLLLQRIYQNKVALYVTSTTTDYVIDWGDGTTTQATGTAKTEYIHEYADDNLYSVEVQNCENVTYCNVIKNAPSSSEKYKNSLIAYWTIGDSKVSGLDFGSSSNTSYALNNLSVVGSDVFRNDTTRSNFNGVFMGTKLSEIPEGIFDNCIKASDFRHAFRGTSIKEIPSGLFSNISARAPYFDGCFKGCQAITEIPAGLFSGLSLIKLGTYSNDDLYSFGCFEGCIGITEIPVGLFDNCTATAMGSCFKKTHITEIPAGLFDNFTECTTFGGCFQGTNITTIPEGLFDNCVKTTVFAGCFADCYGITEIPTGLFDNCPDVYTFSWCFRRCAITEIPAGLFDNCPEVTQFEECFARCEDLISIPDGLFDNCPEVNNFKTCFYQCSALTKVTVPTFPKVSARYWDSTFYIYSNGTFTVIVPQATPQYVYTNTFYKSSNLKIYVPDESVDTYKAATNWSSFKAYIYPMSELPE